MSNRDNLKRLLLNAGAEYNVETQTVLVPLDTYKELAPYLDANGRYNGYKITTDAHIDKNLMYIVDNSVMQQRMYGQGGTHRTSAAMDIIIDEKLPEHVYEKLSESLFNINPVDYKLWSTPSFTRGELTSDRIRDMQNSVNLLTSEISVNPHLGSDFYSIDDEDDMDTVEGRRAAAVRIAQQFHDRQAPPRYARVNTRPDSITFSNAEFNGLSNGDYTLQLSYDGVNWGQTADSQRYDDQLRRSGINLESRQSTNLGSKANPHKLEKGKVQLVIKDRGWYAFAHIPNVIFEYGESHGIVDFDSEGYPLYFEKESEV